MLAFSPHDAGLLIHHIQAAVMRTAEDWAIVIIDTLRKRGERLRWLWPGGRAVGFALGADRCLASSARFARAVGLDNLGHRHIPYISPIAATISLSAVACAA